MSDAWAGVSNVDDVFVGGVGRSRPTDSQGVTELLAPTGNLVIKVGKDRLNGIATVSVSP